MKLLREYMLHLLAEAADKAKEIGIKRPIMLVSNIDGKIIREITIDDYEPEES